MLTEGTELYTDLLWIQMRKKSLDIKCEYIKRQSVYLHGLDLK